ncbi:MAG: hypothetical protein EBT92_02060 [Planctomycetes bacterium]|nr:hypothetical protein [Planctomycetota bacterium]
MKSSQGIIAVLIFGIMVFCLTFAMNYLGGLNEVKNPIQSKDNSITKSSDSTEDGSNQELTFLQKIYPSDGISALENEFKMGGMQDYLYTHDGLLPLKIGLDSKNCTCTSVLLFELPKDWVKNNSTKDVSGKTNLLKIEEALSKPDVKSVLEKQITPVALEKNEQPVLNSGSVGWIRLQWKTEKMGPNRLTANIWMGKKGGGNESRLEALVNVQAALIVDPVEIVVDVLSPLVSEKKVAFKCYSSTRKSFDFIVRMTRPRPDETIQIGKPIPLTSEELKNDEKLFNGTPLLSGYLVPITASYSVPGGKDLMELGPFSRQIEFIITKNNQKDLESDTRVETKITGKVEGEFRILDAEQRGRLSMGVFQRALGVKKDLKIETELQGIDLELDLAKTTSFLKVKPVPGWPQDLLGRRTWKYSIEISPNTVSGPFPRDDEFFRDSSFYLKSKGNASRSIRIPVEGRADN